MSIYSFTPAAANGQPFPLTQLQGKVGLIVNVASKCGFTKQYAGLQKLHEAYGPQGLAIIGFPCNQFGGQEPGTEEQIQSFCTLNFGVTFPLMAKINVNGPKADPLYTFLKSAAPGTAGNAIKWNFTKFLISRNGQTITRFAPATTPEDLETPIRATLQI